MPLIPPAELTPNPTVSIPETDRLEAPPTDEVLATEPTDAITATGSSKIPLSFEVLGAPRDTGTYSQYHHAVHEVFANMQPDFLAVEHADLVARRSGRAHSLSTISTALEFGPASKIVPIVRPSGRDRGEVVEELISYVGLGIDRLIVSPTPSELRSHPSRHTSNLLQTTKVVVPFKTVGLLMRAEQGVNRGETGKIDYDEWAAKLEFADFGLTEPIFTNDNYAYLLEAMRHRGVNKPIIPGLMPFRDPRQAEGHARMIKADFPQSLLEKARVIEYGMEADDKEEQLKMAVISHLVELAGTFIRQGAPSLHIYTGNNMRLTQQLVEAIRSEEN